MATGIKTKETDMEFTQQKKAKELKVNGRRTNGMGNQFIGIRVEELGFNILRMFGMALISDPLLYNAGVKL